MKNEKYFKVGQKVYSHEFGEGLIVSISDFETTHPIQVEFIQYGLETFTFDGRYRNGYEISLSTTPLQPIINKPLKDDYVPFTYDDAELFLGKIVKKNKDNYTLLIIGANEQGVILTNDFYYYKDLFETFSFLDGKPCGKLL